MKLNVAVNMDTREQHVYTVLIVYYFNTVKESGAHTTTALETPFKNLTGLTANSGEPTRPHCTSIHVQLQVHNTKIFEYSVNNPQLDPLQCASHFEI